MNGTYQVQVGDRGRLVVPAEVRDSAGLIPGTPLILVDTGQGLLLLTRRQLRDLVASDVADSDMVGALLQERRAASAAEDAA